MVIFLPNSESNNDQISNGVNLLISLLIRHPEIGTVSFTPHNNCLKLKFMLSAIPSAIELATLKKLLIDSISAYTMLEGLPPEIYEFELYPYNEVAMLSVIRDFKTISKNEIALIIALLREHLEKTLIIDPNESLLEEDLLSQEEVIEDMLENIKTQHFLHPLIGIRESGRILIFNK